MTYREQQKWLERFRQQDGAAVTAVSSHQADLDKFFRNLYTGLKGLRRRLETSPRSEFALRNTLRQLSGWCSEAVAPDGKIASDECRIFLLDRLAGEMLVGTAPGRGKHSRRITRLVTAGELGLDASLEAALSWLSAATLADTAAYRAEDPQGGSPRCSRLLCGWGGSNEQESCECERNGGPSCRWDPIMSCKSMRLLPLSTAFCAEGRRGVVLADEVGFGKTYEALAVMAHLCDHAQRRTAKFGHVLVLCKSSLLAEVAGGSQFRPGQSWISPVPSESLLENPPDPRTSGPRPCDRAPLVRRRTAVWGLRGHRRDGHIQVPSGLYIVNHDLMSEQARATRRPFLTQLWNTQWDLIIVDEAHHYARWNRPGLHLRPGRRFPQLRSRESRTAKFRHILALTATPFELTPKEMVNLLAIVRADRPNCATSRRGWTFTSVTLTDFSPCVSGRRTTRSGQQPCNAFDAARRGCSRNGAVGAGSPGLLRTISFATRSRKTSGAISW